MSILNDTKKNMEDALEHLRGELKGIRTGRANPAILDTIQVEVYGTNMRIKDLATVTTPESRQILITPYDNSNAGPIAKAIEKSNIGLMPSVEGSIIRINVPQMDESIRKQMVKLCGEEQEHCKVSIRNVRREANDNVKKMKNDGDISEDEQKRLEKEIQDLTDKYCSRAETITEEKEKEVMTI